MQIRKRTVTSSFTFQTKCCQISPAIDPERKITSRDLFSAPALKWLSFFWAWQWAFQGDRTEKLGTLGHSLGREGLGPHLECVHCPGPLTSVTDCSASPASFSLLLSLHLGSCISHPLYIVTLHMLCMALSVIMLSITDYTHCSIFNQEWSTIKLRTVTFGLVSYATRHA